MIIDPSQRLPTRRWEQAVSRALERVKRLSREDKLAIALHDFAAVSAEEFIPFDYCDGPNGVRGHQGATAFPSALAVAASFDRTLAHRYGVALGKEVLTAGKNAILALGLDIARMPRGGRIGESLGEDPMLAGEIGGTDGAGIQAEGVLAVAKHYVANNFEWLRTGEGSLPRRSDAIDIRVSSRTLHEIYLEPMSSSRLPSPGCWPATLSQAAGSRSHFQPMSRPPQSGNHQYPGVNGVAAYSEELLVGYRWYRQRGIEPAFPFGHGLGYTSFGFADLRAELTEELISVTFSIRNVGSRRGKAVPQLYVTFPPDAGEPPAQLKAFQVVRLEPGQVSKAGIEIPIDDLAIYDDQFRSRVMRAGTYEIQLGVSSVDLRLKAAVQVP